VAGWCVATLGAHGAQLSVLEVGPGVDRATLAAQIRDTLAGLAADESGVSTGPDAGGDVAGVLSLLALAEGPCPGCAGVTAGLAGTLALVQALGDLKAGGPLWVLTQGAVAAGPGEGVDSPVQAQVWGLGRVAALEYPQQWGGLIDLPPQLTGRAAERLCGLLAGAGEHLAAEDQLAVRETGLLARRLMRAPLPGGGGTERSGEWVTSGTALVTGGTGALGRHLARWVTGRGAERVVLVSRQGPAAVVAQVAATLAGQGAEVVVAGCDVADKAVLAGLLAWLQATGPAVTAVFHVAGVLDDGIVDGLSARRLAGVLGPKAGAAWHLHELTTGLSLDAFVQFSSMAGTVGAEGQGNYAAANAFLDALAEYRRGRGLSAASVAWGPWAGGGMSGQGGAERARRGGVPAMAPELAMLALAQILAHGETAITVADVDWDRFGHAFTSVRPSTLFDGIPEARQAVAAECDRPGEGEPGALLAGRLATLGEAEQGQVMLELVRALAARLLGHASADAVDVQGKFIEMGFTSLNAVELRSLLAAATGLRLPTMTVFDHPTPTALAGFLRDQLAASMEPDRVDTGQMDDPAPRLAPAGAEPSGGLSSLFDQANRDGKGGEFLQAARSVAAFRRSFDTQSELAGSTNLVQISRGAAQPRIICFPSLIGRSSPYQYARFGSAFNATRDVAVITTPGFVEGERLAASKDDIVGAHGRVAQRYAGNEPFVLLGHSGGALIAHHVACHLESLGVHPAALVLIEAYSPDDWGSQQRVYTEVMEEMLQVNETWADAPGGDAWVTAMAMYSSFDWWNLPEVAARTLLVRASEGVTECNVTEPADRDQRAAWRFALDVTLMHAPGNHFTVISDHAASTARAVEGWLECLFCR
jgi:thioesterase domain-containing protein/NAD(P)-dependent dehydrogenase (short-subunit alcohol dehydrogenase family)